MPLNPNKVFEDLYDLTVAASSKDEALLQIEAYLTAMDVFNLKKCKCCGIVFPKVTKWQKFCSEKCKFDFHEKEHGRRFETYLYHNTNPDNPLEAIPMRDGILVRKKPSKI